MTLSTPRRGLAAGAILLFVSALGLSSCKDDFSLIERFQNDVFVQELRRKVDVLLVVDNSCSMIDEQQKLAGNFDNFIEQFLTAEVDYQIGIVTTDMTDPDQSGRLVGETKIITADLPIDEARQVFQDNVKVCSQGSGFERGLAAAEAALIDHITGDPNNPGPNEGFLRDDAALSIVIVSDEDDLSPKTVGEYLRSLKGVKGAAGYRDDTLVNISAVVGDPPSGCEQPAPFIPNCTDGVDNEEDEPDGLIDCEDPDCQTSRLCEYENFGEQDCADGLDDDGDGAVDCADADCGTLNHCRENDCANGLDDDGDGVADCEDMDCLVDQPDACGELSCEDEPGAPDRLLHHGANPVPNFWLDCEDPSCFANPDTIVLCQGGRFDISGTNEVWGSGYTDRCEDTVKYDAASGTLDMSDGLDIDDVDGLGGELAGCDDPDCATYWLCAVPDLDVEGTAECGDCIDNDNDGAEDCEDLDCRDSQYCDNPYPIDPGSRYIDVALRSGGIVTSICAQEFSGLVRELGLNISGLRSIFYLSAWPVLGSIEMRFNSNTLETEEVVEGWAFDPMQNRVVFDDEHRPVEGTTIHLRYKRATQHPSDQDAPESSE
jgi:hypothetical protein